MSVTFQGNPVRITGSFPQVGQKAPSFTLCSAELNDFPLESLSGKKLYSIFSRVLIHQYVRLVFVLLTRS